MQSYLLPRLRDILFLSIFAGAILLGPRMLNQDGDILRHLTMGRYVLENRAFLTEDAFSHTNTGKPFAPHEWLAGVFFYIAYSLGETNGLVLLSAGLLATTFTLLFVRASQSTGAKLPVLALILWGAAISSLHWIVRPHLFTMLFLAIWLFWVEDLAQGKTTRLWPFAALMLVWSNAHGEFIAGFLVLIAALAGWGWDFLFRRENTPLETGKRLGLVTLLSFVTTLINPVGLRTWTTVVGYVNNQYLITHTNETIPPDFTQAKFLALLALLAFSVFLLSVKTVQFPARNGFLLAGFSAMALLSARNVHLYGVVAPYLLAGALVKAPFLALLSKVESFLGEMESRLRGWLWPAATTVLLGLLLVLTPLGAANRFSPGFHPVEAVAWLKENPQPGKMFNAFDWGGYLLFSFWPAQQVFIDSQTDVYGEAFTREYETVIMQYPGWEATLDKYEVSWAIFPRNWPLARALADQGWVEVYSDSTAVIFSRK